MFIQMDNIYPIILSGGSGTRLWPLSNSQMPKQFLSLFGQTTLFQMVYQRSLLFSHQPLIITNSSHLDLITSQIPSNSCDILLEPLAKDTAPAIIMSLLQIKKQNPEAILLIMPADHYIPNLENFKTMIQQSIDATSDHLITFGIKPTYPETGYGYIQADDNKISDHCYKVKQFREKPNFETALQFISNGNFYWNSGIFLLSVQQCYEELSRHSPQLLQLCLDCPVIQQSSRINLIDSTGFNKIKPISIDYALMEKTDKMAVLPTSIQWSDVGSWASLWQLQDKDKNGNVVQTEPESRMICQDVSNSYIINQRADQKIAVIGMENCIIVNTDNELLILNKHLCQSVKTIASQFS
jgi:mannose-1-phosphate guanylyltransferase/mannose-6-phosphate isomerase